jgi:hypothetical protein
MGRIKANIMQVEKIHTLSGERMQAVMPEKFIIAWLNWRFRRGG